MATAKRYREAVMSTEDFDLDRRLESIKATAIEFVQDMDEAIIVDGGMPVRRTSRVWSDEDDEDRWRSNLIGHELRRLFQRPYGCGGPKTREHEDEEGTSRDSSHLWANEDRATV
jgi:hypothetical protein